MVATSELGYEENARALRGATYQDVNSISVNPIFIDTNINLDVYYTDDKKCWQKNFGFARIYDILAPYIALEYDYTRVFYTYDEKAGKVQSSPFPPLSIKQTEVFQLRILLYHKEHFQQ